jgi:hypothetical protein
LQAKRFAEAEGGFEHPPVEAADDQHRRAVILSARKRKQLDAVHPGHSKVERDHVRALGGELARKSSSRDVTIGSKPQPEAASAMNSASVGSSSISSNRGCGIPAPLSCHGVRRNYQPVNA